MNWLLSAVGILIVTHILPGIQVDSFSSALIAAAVIGIVNVTAGLILKLLFLPFILLTLGLFYFLINGLMLKLASGIRARISRQRLRHGRHRIDLSANVARSPTIC